MVLSKDQLGRSHHDGTPNITRIEYTTSCTGHVQCSNGSSSLSAHNILERRGSLDPAPYIE